MPTYTRAVYMQHLADTMLRDVDSVRGTATGGTMTTLVASVFESTITGASKYIHDWITITDATDGTTVFDAVIKSIDGSTGTITLDRTCTFTIASGDSFIVTHRFRPVAFRNAIDDILTNTYSPALFPLTSYILAGDDNDMEDSVDTAWTETNATDAKVTTLPFPTGNQELAVTDDGSGGGYVATADLYVYDTSSYYAYAVAYGVGTAAATLRVWDATNSASIDTAGTNEQRWAVLRIPFTPPDNCEAVNLRLITDTASGVTRWKDVALVDQNQRIFPGPSWFLWEDQMIAVLELPYGNALDGTLDYATLQRRLREVPYRVAFEHLRSSTELMIEVPPDAGNPRYIYAMRPGVALSGETSTGYIAPDIVARGASYLLSPDHSREQKDRFLQRIREDSLRSKPQRPKRTGVAVFAR